MTTLEHLRNEAIRHQNMAAMAYSRTQWRWIKHMGGDALHISYQQHAHDMALCAQVARDKYFAEMEKLRALILTQEQAKHVHTVLVASHALCIDAHLQLPNRGPIVMADFGHHITIHAKNGSSEGYANIDVFKFTYCL